METIRNHEEDPNLTNDQANTLFESCSGMSISDLDILYNCIVYIGNNYTKFDGKRFISVYSRCSTYNSSGYAFYARGSITNGDLNRVTTKNCEVVEIPTDLYTPQELYEDCVEMNRETRIVKVFKMGKTYFAFLSDKGDLFFTDFIHYGHDYAGAFKFVLEAVWGVSDYSSIATEKIRNALTFVAPEKIKRIEVETEFDKKAFIETTSRKALATIDMFKRSADSKSNVLTRKLETERQVYKKRLQESQLASFISGITAMKNSNWEIKKGRLCYSKKIVAKQISWQGKSINTDCDTFYVTGLSLTIAPRPTSAKFVQAYHSNVSASEVCIGDLQGCTLTEIMEKLPKALETCSLNSPYGGAATQLARNIFNRDPEAAKMGSQGNKWEIDNKITKAARRTREQDSLATAAAGQGTWSS
jgi:hypothetical protein